MNFDDLQIVWNEVNSRPSYTIDEKALHRIVVKRARSFWKRILFRDFVEIAVASILVIFLTAKGTQNLIQNEGLLNLLNISLFTMATGCAFVGAFMFVGRQRQKRHDRNFDDSIQGNLLKLISNVRYQIRLLENVFSWYLFPLIPGVILVIVATSESNPFNPWLRGLFCLLCFIFVYWLNKTVVRIQLEPQEKELESLLSRLEKDGE
jgi:hypothetical protein